LDPYKVDDNTIVGDDADSDWFHMVMPPRFLGFSLRGKFWGQFMVDSTYHCPPRNISVFQEKLQMDSVYKEMIQAMVMAHDSQLAGSSRIDVKDLVENKGQGLVLLLHGKISYVNK
jgi:hypothetical protein